MKDLFGYVPDEFGLYDNLKSLGIHGLCLLLRAFRPGGERAVYKPPEQVKLTRISEDFSWTVFRAGMKQRPCLACAMIHDPKLLILDEPTSGMDPRARVEFKELFEGAVRGGKDDPCELPYPPRSWRRCVPISGSLMPERSFCPETWGGYLKAGQ